MKVNIKEIYVKCDICGQKIDHKCFYNNIYQMKVKSVKKKNLKYWRKIDMCSDCYNKFSTFIRKELKGIDGGK